MYRKRCECSIRKPICARPSLSGTKNKLLKFIKEIFYKCQIINVSLLDLYVSDSPMKGNRLFNQLDFQRRVVEVLKENDNIVSWARTSP